MVAEKPSHIQVEIFGQSYSVKAGPDAAYVRKLAAFLDEEMKDLSRASGAVDSLKVAVLTALNMADELFRLREQADSKHAAGAAADERAARLARKLQAALGE